MIMPVVIVKLAKRSAEQKRKLSTLDVKPEWVTVLIDE
jgi:phenylpyruvate tautomerase PptA (4-oxalocrotonate tautomerase family)